MTQEQLQEYAQALGWTPDQVLMVFNYFATGQPG